MNKISQTALFCALIFSACGSVPPSERPAADSGMVSVAGIPVKYQNGVILVSGSGENGDSFCSPEVPHRISGARAEIKIYQDGSMTQRPFAGNGNYLVSVELHHAGDPNEFELRYFNRKFSEGRAEINWNEGSRRPPPIP